MTSLKPYRQKRNLRGTPEPDHQASEPTLQLRFFIQKHAASRLHYDLRLELDGVLKSWAVPKGPSLNPAEPRLAILVEDHPLSYGNFEGTIPKGHYGAGTVLLWDQGTYREYTSQDRDSSVELLRKGLKKGEIKFVLSGQKLHGAFTLVRTKKANEWLWIKKHDEYISYKETLFDEHSILSQRSMEDISKDKSSLKKPKSKISISPEVLSTHKSSEAELFPVKLKPMLPLSLDSEEFSPPAKEWLYSEAHEGLRVLIYVKASSIKIMTKDFIAHTAKSSALRHALSEIKESAIFDAVIEMEEKSKKKEKQVWIYDILHWQGQNLRFLSLEQRLKILARMKFEPPLKVTESFRTPPDKNYFARYKKSMYLNGQRNACYMLIKQSETTATPLGIPTITLSSPPDLQVVEFHPLPKNMLFKESRSSETAVLENGPTLSKLKKIYWPQEQISKGELLSYYQSISALMVKHIHDRPLSLNRYPNGILQKNFYQKNMTGYHPKWFFTNTIHSRGKNESIAYPLCQNEESLLYLINLGCIEIHSWLAKIDQLQYPDQCVIDIDPSEGVPFTQVLDIVLNLYEILRRLGLPSFPKTSGGKGFHIFIPIIPEFTFEEVRQFLRPIFEKVQSQFPTLISLDKNPNTRKHKIYLDNLQNSYGQTMAAAYCVRPKPMAPVSCPLMWKEVQFSLNPRQFHLRNMLTRLEKVGDLWHGMSTDHIRLKAFVKKVEGLP